MEIDSGRTSQTKKEVKPLEAGERTEPERDFAEAEALPRRLYTASLLGFLVELGRQGGPGPTRRRTGEEGGAEVGSERPA